MSLVQRARFFRIRNPRFVAQEGSQGYVAVGALGVAWAMFVVLAEEQERRKGNEINPKAKPNTVALSNSSRGVRKLVLILIIPELNPSLHFRPHVLTIHDKFLVPINRSHQAILTRFKEERHTDTT